MGCFIAQARIVLAIGRMLDAAMLHCEEIFARQAQ
jgi:hypothetical protein